MCKAMADLYHFTLRQQGLENQASVWHSISTRWQIKTWQIFSPSSLSCWWDWDSVKDFGEISWFEISHAVDKSCNRCFGVPEIFNNLLEQKDFGTTSISDGVFIGISPHPEIHPIQSHPTYSTTVLHSSVECLFFVYQPTLARLQSLSPPNLSP